MFFGKESKNIRTKTDITVMTLFHVPTHPLCWCSNGNEGY